MPYFSGFLKYFDSVWENIKTTVQVWKLPINQSLNQKFSIQKHMMNKISVNISASYEYIPYNN